MKFASLLKIHQNQQPVPSYPNNQYLVNCNNNLDQPIIYGGNNYSTLKKRSFQPRESLNQKLEDIYRNYELNPHTHWILELQAHHVRIHKFQPSKFKHKKQQQQIHEQQIYPKMTQNHQKLFQFQHQPNHQQDEVQPSQRFNLRHNQQTRTNYSPMQKMRPKTIGKEQNWMENLNQNKFSFGQDSVHALQEASQQREYQTQQNTDNKSYIEERHDYELPQQDVNQQPKSYCVNLMNEFDNCDQLKDNFNTINQKVANKKPFDQLLKIEKQADPNLEKPVEQQKNPDSRIDFNPKVGFSFEQIDKIFQPTQHTIGPASQNKIQVKTQTQVFNTNNAIFSIKQATQKQEQTKIVQKPLLHRQTSLKKIIEEEQNVSKTKNQAQEKSLKKIQIKTVEALALPSQTKQKQSSPHRIYCKANIRNLTPQNFKYPRVDSKIESNTQVKPFLTETETKSNKSEIGTIRAETEKKIQSTGQRQTITVPTSERLQALIDESKRLLESRHVNEEVRSQDKIRRIVLHQTAENTAKNDTIQLKNGKLQQNETNKNNVEGKAAKMKINEQKQIIQKEKKDNEVTPKKKEIQFQAVSSPKSPIQQKPKFHNQLANMQTNYTPKKVISENVQKNESSQPRNMIIKPSINQQLKHMISLDNDQNLSTLTKTPTQSNNTTTTQTTQQQQHNYLQSKYAYKPLNVPQYNNNIRLGDNKEFSGYKMNQDVLGHKVSQFPLSNTQISNQPYKPIINTYQQLNEASQQTSYQKTPAAQVYTNTTSTSPAPAKTYSPYFPLPANNINKPPIQSKPLAPSPYQPYSYSNLPHTQPSAQPLSMNNNNYIKINPNYTSPFQKYQPKHDQKHNCQVNAELRHKQNFKPVNCLGIEGVKCVESRIYELSTNKLATLQQDPKESSVQFSLRIQQHFNIKNN